MSTSSLSIAISALRAHSQAIDVTSHNIANVATEGYRRERLDLKPGAPHWTAHRRPLAGNGSSR
jgi:flagellar hook-associated protein 1 FlgK